MSGDEHPSGLRDAIAAELNNAYPKEIEWANWPGSVADRIAGRVVAWLSVVSEEEIEAAARAAYECQNPDEPDLPSLRWSAASDPLKSLYRHEIMAALAASREVLIPKKP